MDVSRRAFLAGGAGTIGGGVLGWTAGSRFREETVVVEVDDSRPDDSRAQLVEVIDGDTIDLLVSVGFDTMKEVRVRAVGIDTAEIYDAPEDSEERRRGREQKRFVEDLLDVESDDRFPLVLRSEGETDQYGRWLGDVRAGEEWWTDAVLERWPEATYDG